MPIRIQSKQKQVPAKLKLKKAMEPEPEKEDRTLTMSDYALITVSKSTLTTLIAHTSMERLKEQQKAHPDQERIAKLTALNKEVILVNNTTDNFFDYEKMREIIRHYSPILRKIYTKEGVV